MSSSISKIRISNKRHIRTDNSANYNFKMLSSQLPVCQSMLKECTSTITTLTQSRASPININTQTPIAINPPPNFLDIIYKNSILSVTKTDGHNNTLFVTNSDSNYLLKYNGHVFRLFQYHFHKPAEHTIDGKTYKYELHMVHKDVESNEYIVVGIFLDSDIVNGENIFDNVIYGTEDTFDIDMSKLNDVFSSNFYVYSGSLTTPPFNDDVTWIVFTQPIQTDNNTSNHSNTGSARPIQQTIHPSEVLSFTNNV